MPTAATKPNIASSSTSTTVPTTSNSTLKTMQPNNFTTDPKTSALLAHIVLQTQSNIDFLVSQNYIRASDAAGILSKLADITASSASGLVNGAQRDVDEVRNPVLSVVERMRQLNTGPSPSERESVPERAPSPPKAVMASTRRVVPPPPQRTQHAKALWDYNSDGSDPNDLPFRSGDIIEVISETNPDWWTGRLPNGRQGLFPSNYVEKLPPSSPMSTASPARSPIPVPGPSFPSIGPGAYNHSPPPPAWQGPPQSYGYGNEKQHAVYAPPGPPPPQQYQAPPPPAPAPEPEKKPNKFGGLGNTMATSAAGGLGFGAGAAVGSGIINSIF